MSEIEQEGGVGGGESGDDASLLPEGSDADLVLATLIGVIRRMTVTAPNAGVGVTLVIGGESYSGFLVSAQTWFKHVSHHFKSAAPPVGAESVDVKVIGDAFASMFEQVAELMGSEEMVSRPIGYAHLLNAARSNHLGARINPGQPLRVRIEAVDAWTPGTPMPLVRLEDID
jgi:hypothetical protein